MKWVLVGILLLRNSFFCSFSIAQVLFSTKPVATETLRISRFSERVRFTKPINNFPTAVKNESIKEVDSLKKPDPFTRKSSFPAIAGQALPSGAADRWRNIPSIPPLRVLSRRQYRVSSLYGVRCHPITGHRHLHNGIDFPQPVGTPVYATADGYVRHVGLRHDGLGLSVRIEHTSGYSTTYGHLSQFEVQPGQWIRRGQPIGRVGQTGTATGPHLHYIVQFRGRDVDPMQYCFLTIRQ